MRTLFPRWGLSDVRGESMEPTLRDGDVVLVRWAARVRRGDLVVVRRPDRPQLLLVKRAWHRHPEGWWVEGDNPASSDDSWTFGPVADRLVLGRVVAGIRPLRLLRRRNRSRPPGGRA